MEFQDSEVNLSYFSMNSLTLFFCFWSNSKMSNNAFAGFSHSKIQPDDINKGQ